MMVYILPNVNKKINSRSNEIIFDEHDINTCLQTLHLNYSFGLKEIPTAFSKTLYNVQAFPLCSIFQHSFNSGILPNVWKCGKYLFIKEMGKDQS